MNQDTYCKFVSKTVAAKLSQDTPKTWEMYSIADRTRHCMGCENEMSATQITQSIAPIVDTARIQ